MKPSSEGTKTPTSDEHFVPNVILRMYMWIEESSKWQIDMAEWAEGLPPEIKDTRDGVALKDKVPPPPPPWP